VELYGDEPEDKYSLKVDRKQRKKDSQFFTPYQIALFMAKWLLSSTKESLKILDPAAGLGIFGRALLAENENVQKKLFFTLYEKEEKIFSALQKISEKLNFAFELINEDFLSQEIKGSYDGIIANPPYNKHSLVENKKELHQLFCQKKNFPFRSSTNIYCWFLLKALNLLSENGRLAFIVPSDFLNTDYGKKIKEYFYQKKLTLNFVNIPAQIKIFSEAITTATIILGEKKERAYLNFYQLKKISDLEDENFFENCLINQFSYEQIDPQTKWQRYFQKGNEAKKEQMIKISLLGKFSRGIATGVNHFFVLTKKEIEKLDLPEKSILPCISKAEQIKNRLFSQKDFNNLVQANKKVFLFNGEGNEKETSCLQYLNWGEKNNFDKKFLTSRRKPWYSLEKRAQANLLVSVFNRKEIKIIWNQSKALTLTCFHSFYPNEYGKKWLEILFLYLNTNLAKKDIQKQMRECGQGLGKFEPNDLNQLMIPDFEKTSENSLNELRKMTEEFFNTGEEKIFSKAEEIFISLTNY